jgi:alpha-ketoglutarate-dependent taurine dioxygenase
MSGPQDPFSRSARPDFGKRAARPVTTESLVREGLLRPGERLPLVLHPVAEGVDLCGWAAAHRDFLDQRLSTHGGILFRGFDVSNEAEFAGFIRSVSGDPLEYRERSSPRSHLADNIYTSTEHPADQSIFLHNENSYQRVWPLKIFFLCQTPASEGGETPIADCRRVLARIGPATRERFEQKGWMYVRNFGDGFGLPWWTVFGTKDTYQVEDYCRRNGIAFEWKPGNRLRVSARHAVTVRHPKTGESVWFNHCTFFNLSTLAGQTRATLQTEFAEEDLPTQSFYGDGAAIDPQTLNELRAAYAAETVVFPWRKGDILMLDNMLICHGRAAFVGPRRILVGMSEPVARESVST